MNIVGKKWEFNGDKIEKNTTVRMLGLEVQLTVKQLQMGINMTTVTHYDVCFKI